MNFNNSKFSEAQKTYDNELPEEEESINSDFTAMLGCDDEALLCDFVNEFNHYSENAADLIARAVLGDFTAFNQYKNELREFVIRELNQ